MADAHKNFAYSTVATAPSPASTGTSLTVATGTGSNFPTPPFNATVWPISTQPTVHNAEIVRVTAIAGDVFTLDNTAGTRNLEEGQTSHRSILVGDQIAATVTAKTFTDIEANYMNSWSPFIIQSGGATNFQTLAGNSSQSGFNSMLFFPMNVQFPVRFNQIIMANSLSYNVSVTTGTVSNSYYSYFGLYSISSNSFNLISSNSFSIGETLGENSTSVSLTWNYPTSTATSGYGYGSFAAGNLTASVQVSSYVSGLRAVGLQFGGEMSLSAGMYWMGLLSYRSTAGSSSSQGLSHAGVLGQIINPVNMAGSVSGLLPLGMAGAEFQQSNYRASGWNGRFIMGFMTNTAAAGFAGTAIPNPMELAHLQTANTSMTILPVVSFVST